MRLAKYHGTGNDFILVEDLQDDLRLSSETIAAVCDRHMGVGADGLIRIVRGEGADFFMDYYNADGGVAEMCGNGIRCLGKYLFDRGLATSQEIDVETRAGRKRLVIDSHEGLAVAITVDMGKPSFQRKAVPMTGDPEETFMEQSLWVLDHRYQASAVSMGNPHCVLFLDEEDDLKGLDVPLIGSSIERRPEFPNGTNVEFVKVVDGRVLVRVWERGSGETMACGTGACAALVCCASPGMSGREADVEFPGGVLHVRWGDDDHVTLTGPATVAFEAELDGAWLESVSNGMAIGAQRA